LASLAAGGLSLAVALLEAALAVDESAMPAVLVVVVPETPRSLAESDWKMDRTIDGISAAVRLFISSVEVLLHGRLSWLCSELWSLDLFRVFGGVDASGWSSR